MLLSLMFLFLLINIGCIMETNSKKHEKSAAASDNSKVYYEMPVNDMMRFRNLVNQIKLGDSSEQVISILGHPTYDQLIAGKEADAPIRGRSLKYYVRRYEKNIVNEKEDKLVSIIIDNSNRVVKVMSNCEGIPNR